MTGYKLGVGIDRKEGPFPVVIVLEIPEDATVVTPIDKVRLDGHTPITKLRSNKAVVVDLYPLNRERTDLNWNRLAFSGYELNYMYAHCDDRKIKTIYKIGKDISSDISMNVKESCGRGIHYFQSELDMQLYYDYDLSSWFGGVMCSLTRSWKGFDSVYARDVLVRLSEMEG